MGMKRATLSTRQGVDTKNLPFLVHRRRPEAFCRGKTSCFPFDDRVEKEHPGCGSGIMTGLLLDVLSSLRSKLGAPRTMATLIYTQTVTCYGPKHAQMLKGKQLAAGYPKASPPEKVKSLAYQNLRPFVSEHCNPE